MKNFIFLIFLLTVCIDASAYPIFYTCKDSEITYSDKFDDNDMFDKLMKMEKSKRDLQISALCEGTDECLRDLRVIVEMAGANYEVAKSMFLEKLEHIKIDFEAKQLPIQELESLNKLKESYSSTRACQETKNQLNSSDYLSKDESFVFTPYPYYSNYLYATGCSGVDSQSCSPISKSQIDKVIKESVIMGVDPYLVISLSLMEGGTREIGQLYLDPIGVMAALGCSSEQVANNTNSDKALNSYGTSHVVNAQNVKNPKIQNKLKKYFEAFNHNKEAGSSYYCYETKGKTDPSVFDKPQGNSCCLDLGFKTSKDSNSTIKHALTYHFIDNITKNSFKEKHDPAWRVQRYNGYTDLMGAAEGVSPWRAGVNYYENPAYGYQTMDFILNALMFNPYISNKVNETTKEFDSDWESILCKGKSDGSYYVDSDYYFNKHKESPRLEAIYAKYKRGIPFNSLSAREKKVILADMEETALLNSKIPDRLPGYKEDKLNDELWNELVSGSDEDELFNHSILPKEEWKKEISGKHNLSSSELDDVYVYIIAGKEADKKYDELINKNEKLSTELHEICQKIESDTYPTCYEDVTHIQNSYYSDNAEITKEIKESSPLFEYVERIMSLKKERVLLDESEKKRYTEFGKKYGHLTSKEKSFALAFRTVEKIESLESAIDRFKDHPKFTDETKVKLEQFYSSTINKNEVYDTNEAYKEYFSEIYEKRNTIQKSSIYPWRRLNDEEVSKLVKLYESYK